MQSVPFIPYFTTSRYRVNAMIELAEIKPHEKAADLGSGDGRILFALAKAGAIAHGYELNKTLIHNAKIKVQEAGVESNVFIHELDFWQEDVSSYDIITIYPMPDIMEELEQKLVKELKPGARVLLNYYPFPTWKCETTKDHIYLYRR